MVGCSGLQDHPVEMRGGLLGVFYCNARLISLEKVTANSEMVIV